MKPEEFDEVVDFCDLVFAGNGSAPPNFSKMLPQLYRPEVMEWQWGIRRGGQLMSIVGLFPRTLLVMDETLSVGGIGGVSTHQRLSRGSGHMRTLMHHCVDQMKADGCDLAFLGGQRQRYAYYGFDHCGSQVSFQISNKNVQHRDNFPESRRTAEPPPITFEPLTAADTARMTRAEELYTASSALSRVDRGDEFALYLQSWNGNASAAVNGSTGEMIGYVVASRGSISEVHGASPAVEADIVCAWAEADGDANLKLPPWRADGELGRELSSFAESVSVGSSYNFLIYNWAEVVGAFLKLRAATAAVPLSPGSVAVEIEDYGTILLTVPGDGGAVRCARQDDGVAAHLKLTQLQGMSVLFGPRPPSATVVLPEGAKLLESWCPLPLYFNHQDGV
jgi:hypothetical protein